MRCLKLIAGLTLVLVVAGCGEYYPWGKPTPTPTKDPVCAVREVPAPSVDPKSTQRPAEVPPGWRWIVLSPEVRALKPNDQNRDYCVPVVIHVYASMAGAPPLTLLDGPPHPMPYDASKLTPWTGSYLVLAYDPTSSRFQTPPMYDIQLIATYYRDRDIAPDLPTALRCSVLANGVTVAQDLKTDLSDRATVRCNLKAAYYNS